MELLSQDSLNEESYPHPIQTYLIRFRIFELLSTVRLLESVDKSFFCAQSHSRSLPKKHTEKYVNYKLFGLLAPTYYQLVLTI